jgi:manganese/iron transport system substrate-binding protein
LSREATVRLNPPIFRGLLLAALLALAPLGYAYYRAEAQPTDKLPVVTSVTVFADMIERVGGERVEVFTLVPAGADVHTFQPTPQDVQRASRARVAIWNGLGLDEVAEDTVASLNIPNLTTVTLSQGIEPLDGDEHGEGEAGQAEGGDGHHEGGNPHLWLDPTLAMRYVEHIRDALIEADPANAASYQEHAGRYLIELRELDAWALQEMSAIPAERRKLVTFHDAFPYLARHFGLEVVAVVLRSPGREPSAQEVADLVSEIKAQQIPTVYREPQFSARILELAARDAGVQVKTLYSDALDSQVKTYTDLMRHNVTSLVEGLR